jgi:hypothetical protein
MEACPKCNFSLAPGAQECPACGVILAKFKQAAGAARIAPPSVHPTPPPIPQAPAAAYPVQPPVQNPYVPPAANVEGFAPQSAMMAPMAPPVQSMAITPATLAALDSARPWLGFLVGYGMVSLVLLLIAALGMLVLSSRQIELLPMALLYFLSCGFGYAALLPLKRSTEALSRLPWMGASAGLESFVVEQSQFWRRAGLLTVVTLILMVVGLLGAVATGISASSKGGEWSTGPAQWEPASPRR